MKFNEAYLPILICLFKHHHLDFNLASKVHVPVYVCEPGDETTSKELLQLVPSTNYTQPTAVLGPVWGREVREDSSHCACVAQHSATADRLALGLVLEIGTLN